MIGTEGGGGRVGCGGAVDVCVCVCVCACVCVCVCVCLVAGVGGGGGLHCIDPEACLYAHTCVHGLTILGLV